MRPNPPRAGKRSQQSWWVSVLNCATPDQRRDLGRGNGAAQGNMCLYRNVRYTTHWFKQVSAYLVETNMLNNPILGTNFKQHAHVSWSLWVVRVSYLKASRTFSTSCFVHFHWCSMARFGLDCQDLTGFPEWLKDNSNAFSFRTKLENMS